MAESGLAFEQLTVAALAAPVHDARLGHLVQVEQSWWLVRAGTRAALSRALTDAVQRRSARPQTRWTLEATGSHTQLSYVFDVAGVRVVDRGGTRARTAPIDPDQLIDLLDRAETVGVGVTVVLADPDGVDVVVASDSDAAERLHGYPVSIVMLVEAEWLWAAVAVRGDTAAPVRGAAAPRVEGLPAAAALHGPVRGTARPRRPPRPVLVSTVVVAACLIGFGSWVALRSPGKPASHSTPPTVARVPTPTLPDPRFATSIAFDGAGGDVLLFGGGEASATTWVWSKQTWDPATPHASPTDRYGSAMAYDPVLRETLLFGGREMSGGVPNDTWAWNGRTWNQLTVPGPGPPGYEFSGMAWDAAHRQMVLVTLPGSAPDGDATWTWTWSGRDWLRRGASSPSPPSPASTMTFDDATGTVILVTAPVTAGEASSTWSWDGTSWRELHPRHLPTLLGPSFMTEIPGTRQLLLLTASAGGGDDPQTWTWDGLDWTQREAPLLSTGVAGMATDQLSGSVIAFGAGPAGPLSSAWAWTGVQWVRLTTGGTGLQATVTVQHPSPRRSAATAYDELRHELVLYGGSAQQPFGSSPGPAVDLTDTWIFNGHDWSRAVTSAHPPSSGPMAFDPSSGDVITTVGAAAAGSTRPDLVAPVTWGWDGHGWRQLHTRSELPSGTLPVAMVTDAATKTVVAIATCCHNSGGTGPFQARTSTWIWAGGSWFEAHPRIELTGDVVAAAYDAASERVIATVSGGSADFAASTWAWDGADWNELHPADAPAVDPVTAVMGVDPTSGHVIVLEPKLFDSAGDTAGGTVVWNGATWIDHVDLALPSADTAYGDAAIYEDTAIGRLVVVSSTSHDYSQMWMWTGTAWLELAMG